MIDIGTFVSNFLATKTVKVDVSFKEYIGWAKQWILCHSGNTLIIERSDTFLQMLIKDKKHIHLENPTPEDETAHLTKWLTEFIEFI